MPEPSTVCTSRGPKTRAGFVAAHVTEPTTITIPARASPITIPATAGGAPREIAPSTTKRRIPAASVSARNAEPQAVFDSSKNAMPKPVPRSVPREPKTPHIASAPAVAPTSCAEM